MTTPKSINTNFRQNDDGLYSWFVSLLGDLNNPANRSRLGREAFEVYRLFNGSLAEAQEARRALDEKRGNDE